MLPMPPRPTPTMPAASTPPRPMPNQQGLAPARSAMVQALKAIRQAADQQGFRFEDLLKESEAQMPAGPAPVAAPPIPAP